MFRSSKAKGKERLQICILDNTVSSHWVRLRILKSLYIYTGIKQLSKQMAWSVSGFSLWKWEVVDKQGEKARKIHVVID